MPLAMGAGAVVCLLLGVLTRNPWWFLTVVFLGLSTASYLGSTLRAKFAVWARLLDDLGLRGDEQVVDLGCGRGAVLNLAAARLTTGTATGVDLWRSVDQSGNDPGVTLANAEAEGVADRVKVETGDLTALPFADDSFDVALSSLAMHNIHGPRRMTAVDEAYRVLRPGGRLVFLDISAAKDYEQRLRELGASDVRRTDAGPRLWWGGPWVSSGIVTADKPRHA